MSRRRISGVLHWKSYVFKDLRAAFLRRRWVVVRGQKDVGFDVKNTVEVGHRSQTKRSTRVLDDRGRTSVIDLPNRDRPGVIDAPQWDCLRRDHRHAASAAHLRRKQDGGAAR